MIREKAESLKIKVKNYKNSNDFLYRSIYEISKRIYQCFRSIYRLFTNSDYRSIVCLRLFNANEVHQTTTLTFYNRYPKIFFACRNYFISRGVPEPKILSYGCSTGEEVISLRSYFSESEIFGADINKQCLRQAREKSLDGKQKIIFSSAFNVSKHGPYDAIFCMAVFQRTPHYIHDQGIKNIKKIYSFCKFDNKLIELDKNLNLNGLLVICHAQYLFQDASIASRYETWGQIRQNQKTPIFDKNGELLHESSAPYAIYRKIRNSCA